MKDKSNFEKFTGIYCSGLFIPNSSMLTSICILFDQVYLVDNLEYVLSFAKKYRITLHDKKLKDKCDHMVLKPITDVNELCTKDDPLEGMGEEQKETIRAYLMQAQHFFIRNHELLGDVIKSDMLPDNEPFEIELIKKGNVGELNTYAVREKALQVSLDGLQQMNNLIDQGAFPIVGKYHIDLNENHKEVFCSKSLASLLAMKSVELVIPAMKEVEPEIILEARDRLKDQLVLFWASMLKLSTKLKSEINQDMKPNDIFFEAQEIVDTTVLPALVELKNKIYKDKKSWFYKILNPAFDGVKMFMGNPKLTTENLVITGLTTGMNITSNFIELEYEVQKIKKEAGLTFLLRLDELIK